MTEYLSPQEISPLLNTGKTIEVFLGRSNDDNEIISWVDFQKIKNGLYEVTYYEVYDEGSLEWLDLYAFSFVDPDMEFEINRFENVEDAIGFIKKRYTSTEPKFLKIGGIQNEYEKLLISEGQE
jgi:hypothetical protein